MNSPAIVQRSLIPTAFGVFGIALALSGVGVYFSIDIINAFPQILSQGSILALYGLLLVMAWTAHSWSTMKPIGYVIFALYALLTGFLITPLLFMASSTLGPAVIGKALFAATCAFGASAIIGYTTDYDLSTWGGILMTGVIGLIAISFLGFFFPWGGAFEIGIASFTILLFTAFTAYDIQLIKRQPGISGLMAGLMLFINFINIFTSILRIMLAMGRD
ncbi:MAG: Bax inhibitor-1 family protein [Candidatus Gracilibacteria bacterium]|nr:Bax inhibitor-1 family protein [Candidatus Gracilibacteria bacterium]